MCALVVVSAVGCAGAPSRPVEHSAAPRLPSESCTGRLRVHFYDVGQALAALVVLPDGRRVLVDTGESPARAGCGAACRQWHDHLISGLRRDLGSAPLDLIWITHQHSDHLGGAAGVLGTFATRLYVDNGRDLNRPGVVSAREACDAAGVRVQVVDPEHRQSPLAGAAGATLTPIAPRTWPSSCRNNANECSIGLRVDYCASSILFVGDAERNAEAALDPGGEVTLLQVGHHGSNTSSSAAFLARAKPKYAVISAARPGVGTNRNYCHPRKGAVERLTAALGGAGASTLRAFDDAASCRAATDGDWLDVPVSDRLWATARDGDVVLSTGGNGEFLRH
jgi:competence protein ComEC